MTNLEKGVIVIHLIKSWFLSPDSHQPEGVPGQLEHHDDTLAETCVLHSLSRAAHTLNFPTQCIVAWSVSGLLSHFFVCFYFCGGWKKGIIKIDDVGYFFMTRKGTHNDLRKPASLLNLCSPQFSL